MRGLEIIKNPNMKLIIMILQKNEIWSISVKKNKLFVLFFWGAVAVLLISVSVFISIKDMEKEKDTYPIVYDGSEYNPEIEGVQ